MSEQLVENLRYLSFSDLRPRDSLQITTGIDDSAWKYKFLVNDVASWPSGTLQATPPNGIETDVIPFELHGSGRWTTREQNPVQTQDKAFSANYDGLSVGSFLWGKVIGQTNRVVFDQPGQEISDIALTPFRENSILHSLGSQLGAISVKQIVEGLADNNLPTLEDREVRATLARLIKLGRVSMTQKKVQLFELLPTESIEVEVSPAVSSN